MTREEKMQRDIENLQKMQSEVAFSKLVEELSANDKGVKMANASDHVHGSDLVPVCRHLASGERHDWHMIRTRSPEHPKLGDFSVWACGECGERLSGDVVPSLKERNDLLIMLCCGCADEKRHESQSRN